MSAIVAPLPWRAHQPAHQTGYGIAAADGSRVAACRPKYNTAEARERARGNRDVIVRAVNSYGAMLAALELALLGIGHARRPEWDESATVATIVAALELAKARGA